MDEVEEVKARLDIVDVIGQYVQLQKAGRTFKALCPFHDERTPSFVVSPERQSWHCFGACGTGGDVISFVMRKEGLEFPEALRLLAERAGVRLERRVVSEEQDRQRERLFAANEAAAQWFRNLLVNSEAGRPAREYLERRRIDATTAEAFLLGYSAPGWEAALEHLRERGFANAELLAVGLAIEGERGLHDRFRGRLMFPIWDAKGRVIGFGARSLDEGLPAGDSGPKYINTSQTALFDKGGVLYALDRAQGGIRREGRAIIVEGYMDAIAAHQHGFDNVVASMGTALTERQVRLLKRLTGEIVLALDPDAAGSEATVRSLDVVRDALRAPEADEATSTVVTFWRGLVRAQEVVSVDLRVALLPQGRDPDQLIREDPDLWRELVSSAPPLLDYRFEAAKASHDLSTARGRAQAVQELIPLVGAIINDVVRRVYVQKLSRLALLSERETAELMFRSKARTRPPPQMGSRLASPAGDSRGDAREEFLLALLLRYPSLRQEGLMIADDLLWESENRQFLAAWKGRPAVEQGSDELEAVKEALPVELLPHLERLIMRSLPAFDDREAKKALVDCLRRLVRRRLEAEKQAMSALLAAREEELGASALAEAAASADVSDERIRDVVSLNVRDMETGLKLHGKERSDGPNAVETRIDG